MRLVFDHSQSSTVLNIIIVEMSVEILKKLKQNVMVVSNVPFYTLEKDGTGQTLPTLFN